MLQLVHFVLSRLLDPPTILLHWSGKRRCKTCRSDCGSPLRDRGRLESQKMQLFVATLVNCACWSVCLLKSRVGALRQAKNTFNIFYYIILRHSMKFGHLKRNKNFRKCTVTCSPGNMLSWAEVQLCSGSDWQCDILIRSLLVMFQKHCCPSMFEVHRSSVVFWLQLFKDSCCTVPTCTASNVPWGLLWCVMNNPLANQITDGQWL